VCVCVCALSSIDIVRCDHIHMETSKSIEQNSTQRVGVCVYARQGPTKIHRSIFSLCNISFGTILKSRFSKQTMHHAPYTIKYLKQFGLQIKLQTSTTTVVTSFYSQQYPRATATPADGTAHDNTNNTTTSRTRVPEVSEACRGSTNR
jgi:hypothetical protein